MLNLSFDTLSHCLDSMFLEYSKKFIESIASIDLEKTRKEKPDYRCGYRSRCLYCSGRRLKFSLPRLRKTSIQFSFLKPFKRYLPQFEQDIYNMALNNCSSSEVVNILSGYVSKTKVLKVIDSIYEEISDFKISALPDDLAFLYLDGCYFKIRSKKVVVLTAVGIDISGTRKIIDFEVCPSESFESWLKILDRLYSRGLLGKNLKCICFDGNKGVQSAVDMVYPKILTQTCIFHVIRNIFFNSNIKMSKEFATDVSYLFQVDSYNEYLYKKHLFGFKYSEIDLKTVKYLKKITDKHFNFLEFPPELRHLIRTNNQIELYHNILRKNLKHIKNFSSSKSLEKYLYLNIKNISEKEYSLPIEDIRALKKFLKIS